MEEENKINLFKVGRGLGKILIIGYIIYVLSKSVVVIFKSII